MKTEDTKPGPLNDGVLFGYVIFWISLSLRPKSETKQLNFGLTTVSKLTNHCSASSLTSSATHRRFAVFLC